MSCGNNQALDDLKAKQAELDGLLAGGKDQLGAMQSKLTAMKADLTSFKPTIPAVESLQTKVNELLGLSNPIDISGKIAELKEKFGASVPSLDSLIADLGIGPDALTSALDTAKADVCAKIPNVEVKPDGTVKEEPSEPKVPEEPPVAPVATPVIEQDPYEVNQKLMNTAFSNSVKYIASSSKAGGIFKGFGAKKKNTRYYVLTRGELFLELADVVGADHDTEIRKLGTMTAADYRMKQQKLLNTYPSSWDFKKEGQIFKETYDLVKAANSPKFDAAGSFKEAATEALARRKAKLAAQEV
tara:strand:+ start:7021 stop:7920 length:900 start_codon:yes stop_codon:yes gene_type:complete